MCDHLTDFLTGPKDLHLRCINYGAYFAADMLLLLFFFQGNPRNHDNMRYWHGKAQEGLIINKANYRLEGVGSWLITIFIAFLTIIVQTMNTNKFNETHLV